MRRGIKLTAISLLGLTAIICATVLVWDDEFDPRGTNRISGDDISRVGALTEQRAPFDQFITLFTEIAEEKGGVYAFNLMKAAPLPFGLDQHLLGHAVGDILYAQEGIDGMALCTHDFRNACSHTMVIGALLEFGEGALSQIRDACHNAPGGSGAYTMCFHGLGHGVLAFNAYEMDRTVAMCDKLGTSEYGDREAIECFGGAVMEIIGGGGHDPENWRLRRDEYLDPSDPFGLCASDTVPDEFKPICYTYMTPFAFEAVGADMANPAPEDFEQTFTFCDAVPKSRVPEREACFGGLGKEFIGIATGRNIALDAVPTEAQLSLMYDWCMLAEPEDGKRYCVDAVVASLYWGGEKPFTTVLDYCSLADQGPIADSCYRTGMMNVAQYVPDPAYRESFCAAVPDAYRGECSSMLLSQS